MERNWVVEHRSWGRYPEDGDSYSCTGPYTEKEAKEIADVINKAGELENLLSGTGSREIRYYRADAVKLKNDKSAKYYHDKIRSMERMLQQNKRRGSSDGSNFEVPSNPKAGTFNLGDKLNSALASSHIRLQRH